MILGNLARIPFRLGSSLDDQARTLFKLRSILGGLAQIPFRLRSTQGGLARIPSRLRSILDNLARILSRQQSTLVQELVPFRQSSILVLEMALFLLFCGLVHIAPPQLLHAKRHQLQLGTYHH